MSHAHVVREKRRPDEECDGRYEEKSFLHPSAPPPENERAGRERHRDEAPDGLLHEQGNRVIEEVAAAVGMSRDVVGQMRIVVCVHLPQPCEIKVGPKRKGVDHPDHERGDRQQGNVSLQCVANRVHRWLPEKNVGGEECCVGRHEDERGELCRQREAEPDAGESKSQRGALQQVEPQEEAGTEECGCEAGVERDERGVSDEPRAGRRQRQREQRPNRTEQAPRPGKDGHQERTEEEHVRNPAVEQDFREQGVVIISRLLKQKCATELPLAPVRSFGELRMEDQIGAPQIYGQARQPFDERGMLRIDGRPS